MATTIDIASMAKNREVRKINGQYVEVFPETKAQYVTVDDWQGSAAKLSDVLTSLTNVVHTSGDEIIGGVKTFTSSIITGNDIAIKRANNTGAIRITAGTDVSGNEGAFLTLFGASQSSTPGYFRLFANGKKLEGRPDGTLTWDSKDIAIDENVVHKTGNETVGGVKTFSDGIVVAGTQSLASIKSTSDAGMVRLGGGTDGKTPTGAVCMVCGINNTTYPGMFLLFASNGSSYKTLAGAPDGTLTWDGKDIITNGGNQDVDGIKTFIKDIQAKYSVFGIGAALNLATPPTANKEYWPFRILRNPADTTNSSGNLGQLGVYQGANSNDFRVMLRVASPRGGNLPTSATIAAGTDDADASTSNCWGGIGVWYDYSKNKAYPEANNCTSWGASDNNATHLASTAWVRTATGGTTLNAASASTFEQQIATGGSWYPVLGASTANQAATTVGNSKFCANIKLQPSTGTLQATAFSGNLTGNVTGNCSGTASNVTGTVAIANGGTGRTAFANSNGVLTVDNTNNQFTAVKTASGALYATSANGVAQFGTLPIAQGGTGATSRLAALKALTNESVGTSANYFLTITSSWGKGGYTSVADAKTVLGLKSAAYTESSAYVQTTGDQTIEGTKTFSNTLYSSTDIVVQRNFAFGTWPSSAFVPGIGSKDKNNLTGSWIGFRYDSTLTSLRLYLRKSDDATTSATSLPYVEFAYGKNTTVYAWEPKADNSYYLGYTSNRWKQLYAGTTTISTSDERLKDNIEAVPDAVLDAWGDVDWSQFQFRDSIAEKGVDKARLHNGLVAQRIDEAFKAHGQDASRYGLFCYDEWDATPEEKDEQGNVCAEAKPAGNIYSLRYEEALCMEAAYQRRRADRAEARIAALEQRLDEMETVIATLGFSGGDQE